MKATRQLHNRIAVVFDFDRTLAPSSYDTLLAGCGFDPESFRREHVQPLSEDGWDDTLARFYTIIRETRRNGRPITREHLQAVARQVTTYAGVDEMFDRVRRATRALVPDVDVEFYLLSCGFLDLHRCLPIAREFTAMWGSEFHFDENGEADFVKQMITFPEKVRYVLQLSKGLGTEGANAPADVYRDVPEEQIHVPLDQIVYVGDGGSDMPTFSLMNEHGGLALAVYEAETAEGWAGHSAMRADRRVQDLAPADYRENSELMRALILCVESIAKLVAVRRLAQDA